MINLEYVESCLTALFTDAEIEIVAASDGIGLRAHVSELYSFDRPDGAVGRIFIQLYVESCLSEKPDDEGMGFTSDDVSFSNGIILAEVRDNTDPPHYRANTYSMDEFFDLYPVSKELKTIIEKQFYHLGIDANPQSTFLVQASSLYNDRRPGRIGLMTKRTLC